MCRIGSECSDDFPGSRASLRSSSRTVFFEAFRLRSAGGAFAGEAEVADAALPGLRHSEIGFQEGAAAAGFRRGVGEHPLESFAGLFPALLVRFGGDVEIGGGEPFFVHVEERRAVRGM